jgi:2'-5' RNA ligase
VADSEKMSTDTGSSRRLFLACWPDQALQDLLYSLAQRLQKKHGGRKTARENIHLTLIFLGQVQQHREQQLRNQLRTLDVKQFDLELDEAGAFTHCRINWVGPRIIPKGLKDLHQALKHISHDLGFHTGERAYKPHVSLLRKAKTRPEHAIDPIPWKVDRYCLIESKLKGNGVQYEILEEFQLAKT